MNRQLIVERLLSHEKVKAILATRNREFDPFAALAIEEYELRHTTTLAWLLDPRGSHGLRDHFLRSFLRACLGQELEAQVASAVVVKEVRLKKVEEQWRFVGSRYRDNGRNIEGGRLDLLLELTLTDGTRRGVAIEGKIKAKEHRDQLLAYRLAMEHRFRDAADLLFLTVAGDSPVERDEIQVWRTVAWAKHVAEPLQAMLDDRQVTENVHERVLWFVSRYIALIRRFSEDARDSLVKQIDALWRDPKVCELLVAARLDEDSDGDLCIEMERDRWFLEMVNRSRLKSAGRRLVDNLFRQLEHEVVAHAWHGQCVLFLPKKWPGPLILNGDATFLAYSLEFVAQSGNEHLEMKLWFGSCKAFPPIRKLQEEIYPQLAREPDFQSQFGRQRRTLEDANGKISAFRFACAPAPHGAWSLRDPEQFAVHVREFSERRRDVQVRRIAELLPSDHKGLEELLRLASARQQPIAASR